MHSSDCGQQPLRLFAGDGVWHGEDGSRFAFSLELEAREGHCEGTIRWDAAATPPYPPPRQRTHAVGTEYVRGVLDPETGEARLYGYDLDNSVLLSLDEYRLRLSPEDRTLEGTSRGPWGTWRNVLAGRLRAS
jgi:hypothetical protein